MDCSPLPPEIVERAPKLGQYGRPYRSEGLSVLNRVSCLQYAFLRPAADLGVLPGRKPTDLTKALFNLHDADFRPKLDGPRPL